MEPCGIIITSLSLIISDWNVMTAHHRWYGVSWIIPGFPQIFPIWYETTRIYFRPNGKLNFSKCSELNNCIVKKVEEKVYCFGSKLLWIALNWPTNWWYSVITLWMIQIIVFNQPIKIEVRLKFSSQRYIWAIFTWIMKVLPSIINLEPNLEHFRTRAGNKITHISRRATQK